MPLTIVAGAHNDILFRTRLSHLVHEYLSRTRLHSDRKEKAHKYRNPSADSYCRGVRVFRNSCARSQNFPCCKGCLNCRGAEKEERLLYQNKRSSMVPVAGLEPARQRHLILSQARLPIPSHRPMTRTDYTPFRHGFQAPVSC